MPRGPGAGGEEEATTRHRLIVASLRLPLTVRHSATGWQAEPSSGGLVAALGPLAEELQAQWIGWSGGAGAADDPGRRAVLEAWERERGFVAVDLPGEIATPFYDGFCNATLWPLLHGFPGHVEIDPRTWDAYRAANERFASAIVARARPGDLIWIHDYQLALVPGLVRRQLPDAAIGFFLHVPFPSSEIFRILPERDALLRGILGADLVGFQTHGHLHDARRAILEILGQASRMNAVDLDGRSITLAAIPIGIDTAVWERRLRRPTVAERIRRRRASAEGVRTILAVDRLDETKGVPERLRAYRHLLRRSPEWTRRVQLIQVAVPSRERVPRYAELRRTVSELVGEINGEFATADWNPVAYLRRSIESGELAVLYATADVAWIAPLRDGMNLVAKEYVACQGDGAGVLVLSEFAGAAQDLGEAIRVNPYDTDGSADAIERALTMPADERRTRQAALLQRVRRNDARAWAERFLGALREAAADRGGDRLPDPPTAELLAAARAADRRSFYLDYDGTLVAIAPRPSEAIPTASTLAALRVLVKDPANSVVVLSGRPAAELEAWFGALPGLWLVAEHGAVVRDPALAEWRPLHAGADTRWKAEVRATLEPFADRAPGSFIEEKAYGLAWHYRLADPEFGPFLAVELLSLLDRQLAGTDLVARSGRKVVEVRFAWANKGQAGLAVRSVLPTPDFELALGDDRTDEDLFERLPPEAWTIHVGRGGSRARFGLPGPDAALELLGRLGTVRPERSPDRSLGRPTEGRRPHPTTISGSAPSGSATPSPGPGTRSRASPRRGS